MSNDIDPTEDIRRREQAEINALQAERAELVAKYGQVWSTTELRETDWEVCGFMAPYVIVKDRKTGKQGTLQFQHMPRFYFNFVED